MTACCERNLNKPIKDQLEELGFRRFAVAAGKNLTVETDLPSEPGVYVATLDDAVFWVGETVNIRKRFGQYRLWFSLPDEHKRSDVKTRNQLLNMADGKDLVFFYKEPITIFSGLTKKQYSAHRVEEVMLIDYFQPAWNLRPGGRSRG